MKRSFILFLFSICIFLIACNTTKVKDERYKVVSKPTVKVVSSKPAEIQPVITKAKIKAADTDSSGRGVFGRKVIYRNPNVLNSTKSLSTKENVGKIISTKLCVNRAGQVISAELIKEETTVDLTNEQTAKVLAAFKKYKYEADNQAPEIQCGRMKLRINNVSQLGGD